MGYLFWKELWFSFSAKSPLNWLTKYLHFCWLLFSLLTSARHPHYIKQETTGSYRTWEHEDQDPILLGGSFFLFNISKHQHDPFILNKKWQAATIHSFIFLIFSQKFNTFYSQETTKEIEGWGWKCGYDVGVNVEFWWMARVSRLLTNVMEIQQWEYEQQTGNVLFWSSPDLHCEVIAGQQLDTSCRERAGRCVQCPPGAFSSRVTFFPRSNKLRDATKETLTIPSDGTTNMKVDRRMPLSCLSQEASLVTFRSESIMIPE